MVFKDLRRFCFELFLKIHASWGSMLVADFGHLADRGHGRWPLFFRLHVLQPTTEGTATESQYLGSF